MDRNDRSQKKISKRQAILEATFEVFSEQGYQATKMEHIAKVADVGKGTLYLYFSNKEDLLQEMLKELCKSHLNYLEHHMRQQEHPLDKLRAMYTAHLTRVLESGQLARFNINEFSFVDSEMRLFINELIRNFEALIATVYKDGVQQNIFRPLDEKVVANMLFSSLTAVYSPWDPLHPKSIDTIMDILEQGLIEKGGTTDS